MLSTLLSAVVPRTLSHGTGKHKNSPVSQYLIPQQTIISRYEYILQDLLYTARIIHIRVYIYRVYG